MVARVRMAFVGLGSWSESLAEGAKRSDRIEIAACHSRTEGKMAAFIRKYGGVSKKTFEEVISDRSIDAVVLTTPNSAHALQTIEAARNGKHVFVEKPMALSVSDCKKMIAAAKEANVVLEVGQKERRLVRMRKAKELIDKGAVGRVILAEANYSRDRAMRDTPEMWQWYRKEMPGGPLCSFTVHCADNLNYLVGPVKRVAAFTGKVCGKTEADDVASAIVEFENGALGYLGGTSLTPVRQFIQIHGIEGVVLVDRDGGSVSYQKKDASVLLREQLFSDWAMQDRDACAEEIDEFATCIQEGGKPETGGEEGLAAWAIMEAIIRSAESGGAPIEMKAIL